MTATLRSRASDLVVLLLILAGLSAAGIAPVILFIELFEWLTSSEWPGLTLADGLSLFGLFRTGAESESQRLSDLLMAAPLAVALFVTGIYMFLAGASLGSWDRERRLQRELEEEPPFAWMTLWGAPDVGYLTAFRLLFLDLLLIGLIWLGAAFAASEVILLTLGRETRWLGLCGLLIAAAALLAQRAVGRKLPSQ